MFLCRWQQPNRTMATLKECMYLLRLASYVVNEMFSQHVMLASWRSVYPVEICYQH